MDRKKKNKIKEVIINLQRSFENDDNNDIWTNNINSVSFIKRDGYGSEILCRVSFTEHDTVIILVSKYLRIYKDNNQLDDDNLIFEKKFDIHNEPLAYNDTFVNKDEFVKEMLESILERINLYMRYTDKHIEDFKEEFNRKLSNAFDFFKKG